MSSRIAVCGQAPVSTAAMRSSASTAMRRSASASSVVKMSLVTTTVLTSRAKRSAQRGDERGLAAADRAADADAQRSGAGRAEGPRRVVGQAVVMAVRVAVAPDGAVGRGCGQEAKSLTSQVAWCSAEDVGEQAGGGRQLAVGGARPPLRGRRRRVARGAGASRAARACTSNGSSPSSRTAAVVMAPTRWCSEHSAASRGVEPGAPATTPRAIGCSRSVGVQRAQLARTAAPATPARPAAAAGVRACG